MVNTQELTLKYGDDVYTYANLLFERAKKIADAVKNNKVNDITKPIVDGFNAELASVSNKEKDCLIELASDACNKTNYETCHAIKYVFDNVFSSLKLGKRVVELYFSRFRFAREKVQVAETIIKYGKECVLTDDVKQQQASKDEIIDLITSLNQDLKNMVLDYLKETQDKLIKAGRAGKFIINCIKTKNTQNVQTAC